MTIHAIVPVQRLASAKSRLNGALSEEARQRLVVWALRRVLTALTDAPRVDRVVVVTPDQQVAALATELAADPLLEPGIGLNGAIALALADAARSGADAALVVLGDLPLLRRADVEEILGRLESSSVVLAPDRHGRGTNVLAMRPPWLLKPQFGVDSFNRHLATARVAGLDAEIYRSLGTRFDVDEPGDLELLSRICDRDWIHAGERLRGEPQVR